MPVPEHSKSPSHDQLLTVQKAAQYLGLAGSTLNKWRCLGEGAVFLKMGRAVRYKAEDLEAYLLQTKCRSTSEY